MKDEYDTLIRVSTEEQKQKRNSPDTQKYRVLENSKEETLKKVYDKAVGKTAKIKDEKVFLDYDGESLIIKFPINKTNRLDLKEYLDDLKKGMTAPTLKVTKWDRLSRNMVFQECLIMLLKRYKVKVIAIDDPQDKFTRRILASVNENELDVMAGRVNVIHEKKAFDGNIVSRVPYGYSRIGEKGDRKTIMNKIEADIVKKMFEMVSKGFNWKKLPELYSMGYNTVRNILTNEFYTGKIKYKGKIYSGNHKALVSEELFKDVQNKI